MRKQGIKQTTITHFGDNGPNYNHYDGKGIVYDIGNVEPCEVWLQFFFDAHFEAKMQ